MYHVNVTVIRTDGGFSIVGVEFILLLVSMTLVLRARYHKLPSRCYHPWFLRWSSISLGSAWRTRPRTVSPGTSSAGCYHVSYLSGGRSLLCRYNQGSMINLIRIGTAFGRGPTCRPLWKGGARLAFKGFSSHYTSPGTTSRALSTMSTPEQVEITRNTFIDVDNEEYLAATTTEEMYMGANAKGKSKWKPVPKSVKKSGVIPEGYAVGEFVYHLLDERRAFPLTWPGC